MAASTATPIGKQQDLREAEMEQRVAAPRDLRDWIERLEAIGQVQRIREEIDPDDNAPALLSERLKGCAPGFQVSR